MKTAKAIFLFAFSFLVGALHALTVSTGSVKYGEWNGNFSQVKALADSANVPLIAIWTQSGCSQCTKLKTAAETSEFVAWQRKTGFLFTICEGKLTADAKACRDFAKHPNSSSLPYVCVYWKKADGTVIKEHFIGRNGEMPATSGSLAEQLMRSVEMFTAGYSAVPLYAGGDFLVPGTLASRLEYIPGITKTVEVPLVRTNSVSGAATNIFVCGSFVRTVVWAEGAKSQNVLVDISESTGDISLKLSEVDGKLHSSSVIYAVAESPNSIRNPKFVGESFTWGEWTMDYAAAKAKVAADSGARLLVVFSGVLWCPYCAGIENSLFASADFKKWAEDNKVALVLFDQGRATDPATAAGQRAPRLVTFEGDPRLSGSDAPSGASYVSRKGITSSQANAYINNVTKYTAKWLAPESTSVRLGNPTILLVNPGDESVAARFSAWRDGNKVYDPVENLARLDELIDLAGENESSAYRSTSTLEIDANGSADCSLEVNAKTRFYAISGLTPSTRLKIRASSDVPVSVSVWDSETASALASGTGEVSYFVNQSPVPALFVKVSAYEDSSAKKYAKDGDTSFNVGLIAQTVPVVGEISFDQSDFGLFKRVGEATVSLTRKNGSAGACKVAVRRVGGTAPEGVRYDWSDKVFSWADGEAGTKEFAFTMKADVPYYPDQTVVLQIVAVEGDVDVSPQNLTITLTDTDAPTLAKSDYTVVLYKGFNASFGEDGSVYNATGDVNLKKVSGKLPGGIKVSYNEDEKAVEFSKSPSKVGKFTAQYTISDDVATSDPFSITFDVRDPSSLNAYLGKAISVTLPLFRASSKDLELAGQVELSISKSNKIKAKYTSEASAKKISISGLWDDLDEDFTAVTSIKAKTGQTMRLALTADGIVSCEIEDPVYGAETLASGEFAIPSGDYSAYKGVYTVTLPAVGVTSGTEMGGNGYAVLKFTSTSAVKTGKVACSLLFPDGKKTSLTSTILPVNDDFAVVVLFKKAFKNTVLGVLKIRKNAASAPTHRAVREFDGTSILWKHEESGNNFVSIHNAYGSHLSSVESLVGCCQSEKLEMFFDCGSLQESDKYGKIQSVIGDGSIVDVGETKISLAEKTAGYSMSYTRSTGIVKGKCKIVFADGKTVSASYAGVVVPDWYDCGCEDDADSLLPLEGGMFFAEGTVWFKDTVNGKAVTRSFPFGLGID